MKLVDCLCYECSAKFEVLVESDVRYGDYAACSQCGGRGYVVPSAVRGWVPGSETPCSGGSRKSFDAQVEELCNLDDGKLQERLEDAKGKA